MVYADAFIELRISYLYKNFNEIAIAIVKFSKHLFFKKELENKFLQLICLFLYNHISRKMPTIITLACM